MQRAYRRSVFRLTLIPITMKCNMKNVLSSGNNCQESPAGIANFMFVVPLENIATIEIDDAHNRYNITPKKAGDDAAATLKGFRIDFKSQTGHVTSTPNAMGGGWSHVGEGRVEMNEDDMALVSRTLHNFDKYITLWPTGHSVEGQPEWKVVGNENGEVEWAVNADSGQNRSDDHGQTFSATCPYQVYPVMKYIGAVDQATDDDFGA